MRRINTEMIKRLKAKEKMKKRLKSSTQNEQSTWCDTFDANANSAVSIIDRTIAELLKIKEIIQNEIKENEDNITKINSNSKINPNKSIDFSLDTFKKAKKDNTKYITIYKYKKEPNSHKNYKLYQRHMSYIHKENNNIYK